MGREARNVKKVGELMEVHMLLLDYEIRPLQQQTPDFEKTLKRLLLLKKTHEYVFDTLRNQSVDLVLTAHPTQSNHWYLLQKCGRICDCFTQLYAKKITPTDKQELDEALQQEIRVAFLTDEDL